MKEALIPSVHIQGWPSLRLVWLVVANWRSRNAWNHVVRLAGYMPHQKFRIQKRGERKRLRSCMPAALALASASVETEPLRRPVTDRATAPANWDESAVSVSVVVGALGVDDDGSFWTLQRQAAASPVVVPGSKPCVCAHALQLAGSPCPLFLPHSQWRF